MLWSISDEYFELREHLGLVIGQADRGSGLTVSAAPWLALAIAPVGGGPSGWGGGRCGAQEIAAFSAGVNTMREAIARASAAERTENPPGRRGNRRARAGADGGGQGRHPPPRAGA